MINPARQSDDLRLTLAVILSFFFHTVVFVALFTQAPASFLSGARTLPLQGKGDMFGGRDIIVNVNQDNKRVIDAQTLLSDKDSSPRGYITRERGDRFLNNSLDFKLLKGSRSATASRNTAVKKGKNKLLTAEKSDVVVYLTEMDTGGEYGGSGFHDRIAIPDKNGISRQNALYFSNSGVFSFGTVMFKHFEYFRRMKDRISSHWYPPLMANAAYGYSPMGGYAPGRTRIMAIPSQQVKLYFIMNRKGEVLEVKIVDSYGHKPLDQSCIDAIRLSKSFGAVPDGIKGELVLIPFIFGYYVD